MPITSTGYRVGTMDLDHLSIIIERIKLEIRMTYAATII